MSSGISASSLLLRIWSIPALQIINFNLILEMNLIYSFFLTLLTSTDKEDNWTSPVYEKYIFLALAGGDSQPCKGKCTIFLE